MSRTERIEQGDIDAVFEAEREGGHPIGHRAVGEVIELPTLERTEGAQLSKTIDWREGV